MTRRKAFTLIELLVVISIIALLMSILLATLSRAREQAKRIVCLSNQRQIGMSLLQYTDDYGGRYPSSSTRAMNAFLTFELRQKRAKWGNLGRLFDTKIITQPKHFYCPSQRVRWFTYPFGWEEVPKQPGLEDYIFGGYMYQVNWRTRP